MPAQYLSSKFLFNGFAQSDYFDLAPVQIAGTIYAVSVLFDTASILQVNTAHISPVVISFDAVNTFFVDSVVSYIPFLDIVTTFAVNAGRITPAQIPIDISNEFLVNAINLFGSTDAIYDCASVFTTNAASTKQSSVVFDNIFTTTIQGQKYLVGLPNIDVTTTLNLSTGSIISAPVTIDMSGDLVVHLLTTDTLGVKLVYFTLTSIDSIYFTLSTFRFKNV